MHKKVHAKSATKPFNPFPYYNFTGSLRPVYPLSPKRTVPSHIQVPDYAGDGIPRSEQKLRGTTRIKTLTDDEIEQMRIVCRLGREILKEGAKAAQIGTSTDEIDRVVHEACIGADNF